MAVADTMVGGQGPGETWELNARASVKPAGFFEIAWDTAGIAADRIDKITLRLDAVGVGYTRDQALGADGDLIGDRIEGTDISMWEARRASWNRLASCTPTAPSTNTCVVTFEPFRYVLPGTQRLYARVVPTQGSGNGPELAHVDIDYMELTVEYSP